MSKKRNALGRGLSALLEDSPATGTDKISAEVPAPAGSSMTEIPIEAIEVNPFQPRTHFEENALNELAESIKVHGIIQPITVRKLSKDKYQLISGERRFQASKKAGLQSLPAYVRAADDQQMLEMALIENIQRQDLNAIEVALSYQRLISECDLKQEELGDRVGKNRSTITNYLRLLKLPPDIQIAVRDNKISMGHARAIINIENADAQLSVYKKILKDDLSVRQVEAVVRQLLQLSKEKQAKPGETKSLDSVHRELNNLQSKLSSHFGTKVQIKSDGKKGDLKIPFYSIEDLNRILDILKV
jgi:ParB family transcriptional regulator, chromosome partitioning protein